MKLRRIIATAVEIAIIIAPPYIMISLLAPGLMADYALDAKIMAVMIAAVTIISKVVEIRIESRLSLSAKSSLVSFLKWMTSSLALISMAWLLAFYGFDFITGTSCGIQMRLILAVGMSFVHILVSGGLEMLLGEPRALFRVLFPAFCRDRNTDDH